MKPSDPDSDCRNSRPGLGPILWLGFLCLFVSGCGGCRDDSATDTTANDDPTALKKDEKPKEPFEVSPVVLYPGEFSDEARVNRHKPGHFATASMRVTSNKSNVNGELQAHSVSAGTQPLEILGTGMYINSERPVTLAREEKKNLEALVFLPHRDVTASNVVIRAQMLAPSGLPIIDTSGGAIALKGFQYHIVMLSSQPDELKYMQAIDCIQIPAFDFAPPPSLYHLVRPTKDDPVPLSSNSLAWTTIAYVVWDGYDPDLLEESQKQAMLDWLHFGGQLVINGPGSLNRLQGSFLDPWLPATEGPSRNITGESLVEFNRNWGVPSQNRSSRPHTLEIPENTPMLGIELVKRPGAKMLDGTDGLAVEKQIGRGRIVACGFSLADPRLRRWAGMASFLNSALLRKPHRRFSRGADGQVSFGWIAPADTFDLSLGSTLRYLVRDLRENEHLSRVVPFPAAAMKPYSGTPFAAQRSDEYVDDFSSFSRVGSGSTEGDINSRFFDGTFGQADSGVAGWNDDHGIAEAARRAITQSAGIRPPSRSFVIQMLAGYLIVLVPLNWLLFRLIGRVEWAWIAAPLIAIVAAVLVVRMASLDIGFARSQTVLGVLEMHADYPRAHLTEYSALYTSLSTNYAIEFDDMTGVAIPFKGTNSQDRSGSPQPVTLERTIANRMRGFPVKSNSTRSLHLETMVDTGGTIRMETSESGEILIVNESRFSVTNAGIVRRKSSGKFEVAWLGDLPAGESRKPEFHGVAKDNLYNSWDGAGGFVSFETWCRKKWDNSVNGADSVTLAKAVEIAGLEGQSLVGFREYLIRQANGDQNAAVLNARDDILIGFSAFCAAYKIFGGDQGNSGVGLGEIFDVVSKGLVLGSGESRLIGEIEGPVGRHKLKPEATQKTQSTLLVVHLHPADLPPARCDENALQDFLEKPDQDRWMKEIDELNNPKIESEDMSDDGA